MAIRYGFRGRALQMWVIGAEVYSPVEKVKDSRDLSRQPNGTGLALWDIECSLNARTNATAGPSAPFVAKNAPNFAQDENYIINNYK